jgi:GT2 family glycosyltransferase
MTVTVTPVVRLATVTYFTPLQVIERFLLSARRAHDHFRKAFPRARVHFVIVDNSPSGVDEPRLNSIARQCLGMQLSCEILSGHGNIGYGAALNRAVLTADSDFTVIMNPDIVLESDALTMTVSTFGRYPQAGLLTPCFLESGQATHLCKRLPSLAALLLRRIPGARLPKNWRSLRDHYEMRDLDPHRPKWDPALATGAFMAFRTELVKRIGGFDENYFLYFEDFDLSIRFRGIGHLLYTPEIRLAHAGGRSTPRVWWRVPALLRSAWRFWTTHGLPFVHASEQPGRVRLATEQLLRLHRAFPPLRKVWRATTEAVGKWLHRPDPVVLVSQPETLPVLRQIT